MDGWGIIILILVLINLFLYFLNLISIVWATRIWDNVVSIYKGIIGVIIGILYSPIAWIFKEIDSLGRNIYGQAVENKIYGLVLGAIIIVAIILNYASYNPEAGTINITNYLFPIAAILCSAFAYILFNKLNASSETAGYSIMLLFLLIGIMFGAAFYFYSTGLMFPILAIAISLLVYLILTKIVGTTMQYIIMALTSVSMIFGLILYYLSVDAIAVSSTILYAISGILTFAVVIALSIIFYFYSNYLKTVGGWRGWLVNFIFYVPCLVLDFINYIKSEIGLTSNVVYYLFVLELLAALLYIYIPKIANKVVASEGTPLLAETAFLDIKKDLGSGYNVAFKNIGMVEDAVTTYKRSYSISMWIYLNIQPPNYSSYAKESEIFNYGNGLPKVCYINNVDTDGSKTPDVLKVYYTNKGDEQSYTVNIKPQKWNQLVFNYTSSQVDLFINGHLGKTFVFNGNEPEYLASDIISVGSTDGLDGAICNIKYHYVPQSKGQIATSYNLLMKRNPPTNIL